MMDDVAKDTLQRRLQRDRESILWKIDGLSEYDLRRPLTVTGTNILGLVKHLATIEARYFGEVFGRPNPEVLPPWQDHDGVDLWVTEHETREQITAFYRRTWAHSDATIHTLELNTPGHVPWWSGPDPNTTVFEIMLHVLSETVRHAGHLDILREGLDGQTGLRAGNSGPIDDQARASYCAKVEQAARAAAQPKA